MSFLEQFKIDEFTTGFYNRIDLSGYVLFIENDNQNEVVHYIKTNYTAIQDIFSLQRKKFILLSEITGSKDILKQITYEYPILAKQDILLNLDFDAIKRYLGYKGTITTGLLSIDSTFNNQFIEFNYDSAIDFKKLAETYLDDYKIKWFELISRHDDMLPSSSDEDTDDKIKLDSETEKTVKVILEQLQILKDKGSLLQVLPIVENYLKTQNKVSINQLSTLKIDENLSILLPDYNLEVKLSHLTKSIYLLFLNHPEGILLSALENYKNELLGFYKSVSNKDDLDKMVASINDVINTKTNAIYVHLSRIKSTITKLVHPSIAAHYCIDGGKNKPKRIQLNKRLILWDKKPYKVLEIEHLTAEKKAIQKAKNLISKFGLDDNEFDAEAFWGD
jgi:hypothetical protein